MKWKNSDIDNLIRLYPNNTTEEISKILNKSKKSIEYKAYSLNLKKSKEHKSLQISKRNKLVGRDMTYERVKEICKKYKTRSHLQKCDPSAYKIALDNNWLDECCEHMTYMNYSTPQLIIKHILEYLIEDVILLYNTRKIISPYELDIYLPQYKIAFEYNGKGWHSSQESKERDNKKINLCKKENIKLITINENSRDYFKDIKNQLIIHINSLKEIELVTIKKINNISENFIMDKVYYSIVDFDDIKQIIEKYSTLSDFRNENINLYNKILKMKRKDLLSNLKQKEKWNINKCVTVISKYNTKKDFRINEKACYSYIMKNDLKYLMKNLI